MNYLVQKILFFLAKKPSPDFSPDDLPPVDEENVIDEFAKLLDGIEQVRDDQQSQRFIAALRELTELAQRGNIEASMYLAELLTFYGPHRDPQAAYKWFNVDHS
ncbi:MAG: hypothetical protein ACI915_004718 [Gammaproteobacteria bacterium]|jgi:hypothetical protein